MKKEKKGEHTPILVDDSEWLFDGIPAEPIGAHGETETVNGPLRWAIDAEEGVWITCGKEWLEKPDRQWAQTRLYWYDKAGYEEVKKLE